MAGRWWPGGGRPGCCAHWCRKITGEWGVEAGVGNWAWGHRRWLWASGCVPAVLGIVGFSVRAPVKDWWLACEACGGKLPSRDLETVRMGVRLGAQEEAFDGDGAGTAAYWRATRARSWSP